MSEGDPSRTKPKKNQRGDSGVPFISDWNSTKPFADIEGNASVDDPARMLEGWQDRRVSDAGITFEAEVEEWNTVPAALLHLLAKHRRAVARIVVPAGSLVDHRGVRQETGWNGTGFLVGPNLLLTNHHVLNSPEVAAASSIEFDFEWPADNLFMDLATPQPPTVRFKLDPTRLFVTSPAAGGLDFTFVWISEDASSQFGAVPMERGSFMIRPGEPTFIIHHPEGRLKEVSLDDTELLGINAACILYAADTRGGSSGACVFNNRGKLIALHHASREGDQLKAAYPDALLELSDGRAVTIANEGIKIAAIAVDLEARMSRGGTDAESAAEVLRQVEGSDTLTGVFGGLGRSVDERLGDGHLDHERVLAIYQASGQDIDVGFWNLHWLRGADLEPGGKLHDTATSITDLNLDVWCLIEVPPGIVEGIVGMLKREFGEEFQWQYVEEDADRLQLATALIWRRSAVSITGMPWPAMMEQVWTRSIRQAGSDAPGRPVFEAAPAMYRLRSAKSGAEINLVPVNFRKLGSDELRRRLASKFLVHAIDGAIASGDTHDWLLGGDFRPPLARDDSRILADRKYQAMAAKDEVRGGAFSYLRSLEHSPVGRIFVTGDLSPIDDAEHFIEVVNDRTVDKYIKQLADNRPVVLRLSLVSRKDALAEDAIEALFETALGTARPGQGNAPRLELSEIGQWSDGLRSDALTKEQFLRVNTETLSRLCAAVNQRLRNEYGTGVQSLTAADLWVIVFAEAGLKDGLIDPDARHSLGERGLLPLPANIRYWAGSGAPQWDQPMPLATNLYHYALYLGQLKNKGVKQVEGRMLYRDLFREPHISGVAERGAKLLAGIVHGYFVKANYGGGPVPFDHLLQAYSADAPVDRMLAGTNYVHAGTSILTNRERNLQSAVAAYTAFAS